MTTDRTKNKQDLLYELKLTDVFFPTLHPPLFFVFVFVWLICTWIRFNNTALYIPTYISSQLCFSLSMYAMLIVSMHWFCTPCNFLVR